MPSIDKTLLRLAVAIRAQLATGRARERPLELPVHSWRRSERLVRQLRRAELCGWNLAAARLREDLRIALPSLEDELAVAVEQLPVQAATANLATTGDLYQDLVTLGAEFDELDFDRQAHWLSVTTEPIELEGQYLGPFEIRFDWGLVPGPDVRRYRILAREPQPARARANVTHPHVADEVLCEGDGRQPIERALAQGRLLDFFTLVANLLRTYNPESPFVELALWNGEACADCGAVITDEERYVCQRCEAEVCDECEVNCAGCGDACCGSCVAPCRACDDASCRDCLAACARCRAYVCRSCLDDHERCPNCHEEEPQEITCPTPSGPDAAVQPHGLGQALVSA